MNIEQKAKRINTLVENEKLLKEQLKALEDERKGLESTFEVGSYNAGEYIVDVKPTVRFDAATAKKVLSEEEYSQIVVPKVDATIAKSVLRGFRYEDCQKVTGQKVTVKVAD